MTQSKKNLTKIFFVFFFLIIFLFPGSKLLAAGGEFVSSIQEFVTFTPSPTPTQTFLVTSTPTPQASILSTYDASLLEAFIQAPSEIVESPYVILNAIELGPETGGIVIKGSFSDKNFVCDMTPCLVPFPQSDSISFRAYSDANIVSEDVIATVIVEEVEEGFLVRVSSVNKYTSFTDSCRQTWGLGSNYTPPVWAEFPQFYFELNTQRTLHYLAAKLIVSGIVDVSACANGGVSADLTWPTGCGLEQAREEIIEWQNQYDSYIWTASKDVGVPPKLLKTLIQTESQFWPSNQRFYLDEYGLGQVTQLGLDVLLRDDPFLFQSFCPRVLEYCNTLYVNLSPEDQSLVRGALLASLNATCPECDNGFDITRAGRSVFYVARLIQANCREVDAIIGQFGTFEEIEYEDYWKFTLFTYHSGIVCFHSAVEDTLKENQELVWENLSENTSCVDGKRYVDGIWGDLISFDLYTYQADVADTDFEASIFEIPPTPTPQPTVVISTSEIQVTVFFEYLDGNTEPVDDIKVTIELDNEVVLTGTTVNGVATFDMGAYPAYSSVEVSLPGLYRAEAFELPSQGVMEVTFIFASPSLPPALP